MGIQFSPGVVFLSEKEILAEIADQNVSEVYRIKKRNPEFRKSQNGTQNDKPEFIPSDSFILTFNTTRLPNSIKMGYLKINVRLEIKI